MIKLLLVEDHTLVRMGISLLLKSIPDVTIIGECDNGETAIRETLRLKPDVVLMDLSLPTGMTGFTAIQAIKEQMPDVRIVILTMYDGEGYVQQAVMLGVEGYILKNGNSRTLRDGIVHAYEGKWFYRTSVGEEKIKEWLQNGRLAVESVLTAREQEIVHLAALGFANKEIARSLHISVKTVENHKTNIMSKLGLSTRQELIAYAIRNNYLDLST